MMKLRAPLLLSLGVLMAAATNVSASQTCDATGRCVVGIPTARVSDMPADRTQQMSQWCWAASISMAFGYYGHPVEQITIVRTIWGRAENLPAYSGSTIISALARTWTDKNGHQFRAHGRYSDVSSGANGVNNDVIAAELAANRPLIVGTQGHAMLVTAMSYARAPTGGVGNVFDVTVRDPWPGPLGQGVRRSLTQAEMTPTFITTISIEEMSSGDDDDDDDDSSASAPPPPRPAPQTVVVPCTHPSHPAGDVSQCIHPAHPMGDALPCQHLCPGPFGPVACHPMDLVPCSHPAHPLGDFSPCHHPMHPTGDLVTR